MHSSLTIANRLLALAKKRGDSITPMQLLKLVYIAHGWMLGLYGRPLIKDEIQAWQYGPVIPTLYNAIKCFKANPVEGPLLDTDAQELTKQEEQVINDVYKIYGSMSGPALSRLTHAKGTPWEITYVPGEFGLEIQGDIIEDHYSRLAQQRQIAN